MNLCRIPIAHIILKLLTVQQTQSDIPVTSMFTHFGPLLQYLHAYFLTFKQL